MHKIIWLLPLIVYALASCRSSQPPIPENPAYPPAAKTAYPVAATSPAPISPESTLPSGYPILPTSTKSPQHFQIDRPVKPGDTMIRGSGPANVPVVIVNVTTMGEFLGQGVIKTDNRFEITVPPLPANVRVGLALGDLTGTSYRVEDFAGGAFTGDNAMLIPQVGYFYDTVFVKP